MKLVPKERELRIWKNCPKAIKPYGRYNDRNSKSRRIKYCYFPDSNKPFVNYLEQNGLQEGIHFHRNATRPFQLKSPAILVYATL